MTLLFALWSLLAWPLAFAQMALAFLVSVPVSLFVPFERIQLYTAAPVLWRVLYLTLSRITYTFHPDHDVRRTSVYCMNHTSMLDAHASAGAIRRAYCGLENAAHYRIPIYGWLMKIGNGIPVPKGEGRLASLVAAAKDRAARDISILTFPEGHRTLDGKVRPFKRGAFVMARDAGMPVVPLACRGMYKALHKGTWIIRPSHIEVWVGPQLETAGLSDEELDRLAERVHEIVAAFVERGERIV